jgi:hypothetical protein
MSRYGGPWFATDKNPMIKKRSAILLAFAALVAGGVIGSGISSYCSGQVQQFLVIADSLKGVSDSYKPLKMLRDGDTTNAVITLQSQMTKALQRIDLVAQTYGKPEILTNDVVVNAKALK